MDERFDVEVTITAKRKSDGAVTMSSTLLQGDMSIKDTLNTEKELASFFVAKLDAKIAEVESIELSA